MKYRHFLAAMGLIGTQRVTVRLDWSRLSHPGERDLDLSLGEGGGRGAWLAGTGYMAVMVFLMPAVNAAATCIHEEVADGAKFQSQLLRDGHLHFPWGPLVLLENGDECAPLQVGEDQALLLGCHIAFLVLLLFLTFASCGDQEDEQERSGKREVDKENGEEKN